MGGVKWKLICFSIKKLYIASNKIPFMERI